MKNLFAVIMLFASWSHASELTQVVSAEGTYNFLINEPSVLPFETADYESEYATFSPVDATRITIAAPGVYRVSYLIESYSYMEESGMSSLISTMVRKNGTETLNSIETMPLYSFFSNTEATANYMTVYTEYLTLAENDYLELVVNSPSEQTVSSRSYWLSVEAMNVNASIAPAVSAPGSIDWRDCQSFNLIPLEIEGPVSQECGIGYGLVAYSCHEDEGSESCTLSTQDVDTLTIYNNPPGSNSGSMKCCYVNQ